MRSRATLVLGLALLVAAGALARDDDAALVEGGAADEVVAVAEPLAAALAPLGPLKAVVSSALWVHLVRSELAGDAAAVRLVTEGLLAVHPELERVRQHLASELIVGRAPQAPDAERHRALVQRGLAMLEEGLALHESARLHGALGRIVALQSRHDPRFDSAARQYFGGDPGEVAIDELRLAGEVDGSPVFLADLLVDRGLRSWTRDDDLVAADRDLAEAERLTRAFSGMESEAIAERIAAIRARIQAEDLP